LTKALDHLNDSIICGGKIQVNEQVMKEAGSALSNFSNRLILFDHGVLANANPCGNNNKK